MTRKSRKNKRIEVEHFPRKSVPCLSGETEEDTARNYAQLATSAELAAFRAIHAAESSSVIGEQVDIPSLINVLREHSKAISDGSLVQAESMLISQSTALQSLFARLTEKAMDAGCISGFEAYMRMALRAQSQCRATLETLSAIKNPPVVYAKHANIAQGHQQINNGSVMPLHTQEFKTMQTQQSGEPNELRENPRTPGIEKKDDSTLEAMGEVNRTKVRGG